MAASCVYAVCRRNHKPLTLLDISVWLFLLFPPPLLHCHLTSRFTPPKGVIQCNVFKLGRVFTRIASQLNIHFDVVDPSLFVDRICNKLSLDDQALVRKVRDGALKILRVAENDWLLPGRLPAAVSAAAVLVALKAHRIDYPVSEIASGLHIANRCVSSFLFHFFLAIEDCLTKLCETGPYYCARESCKNQCADSPVHCLGERT